MAQVRYHSGVSPYGVHDLCGNIWEWLSTESDAGRYELKGSAFTSPIARAMPSAFNDAFAEMLDPTWANLVRRLWSGDLGQGVA
jgi:formylglycine-generating enzyme required for sulfatase activity